MKLSHSKLSTLLSCPATYFLSYKMGISLKKEKSALAIGSAVHWGIEHDTEDLSKYWNQSFKTRDNYGRDQFLSEAMVHGYLKHKENIFEKMLIDSETGEKLELIDEKHELYITGQLKSYKYAIPHEFVGIIDLLLLTNKGFVIIDYKTSSFEPNWDNYLDQIYRYIFLLRCAFPEVPVVKIGIINLRKTAIRQKKNENEIEFVNRLKFEYELNDENYVNYHEYDVNKLEKTAVDSYIENLSRMADAGQSIDENQIWYINFAAANGQYGKSDFWDIFYKTPDAYILYKIKDSVYNEELDMIEESRDCLPIDMDVLDCKNCMNKYDLYEIERKNIKIVNISDFWTQLSNTYIVDKSLLKLYEKTYLKKYALKS